MHSLFQISTTCFGCVKKQLFIFLINFRVRSIVKEIFVSGYEQFEKYPLPKVSHDSQAGISRHGLWSPGSETLIDNSLTESPHTEKRGYYPKSWTWSRSKSDYPSWETVPVIWKYGRNKPSERLVSSPLCFYFLFTFSIIKIHFERFRKLVSTLAVSCFHVIAVSI